MDLFQATIIYLACGTPFGFHYYYHTRKGGSRRHASAVVVALFWIAYLPSLLNRLVTPKLNSSGTSDPERKLPGVGPEIRECSRKIEAAAVRSGMAIYEVRNTVERFAGISAIYTDDRSSKPPRLAGLSDINGHPDPDLFAAVIARRNRSVVERHRRQATRELIELHERLSRIDPRDPGIDSAFIRLFELSGNIEAAERISKTAEQLAGSRTAAVRPRASRTIWRSTDSRRTTPDITLRSNKVLMRSHLRNED